MAIIVAAMLIGFIALIAALNALFATVTGWFGYSISFGASGLHLLPGCMGNGCAVQRSAAGGQYHGNQTGFQRIRCDDGSAENCRHALSACRRYPVRVLVSFANFSSIGIIAGAIKGLNEEQGNVVSRFGLKLVYGSTLVSVLSASIAALVL